MHMRMHVRMRMRMRTRMCMRMRMHMLMRMHMHVHPHTYMHMHVLVHAHVPRHRHRHMHRHRHRHRHFSITILAQGYFASPCLAPPAPTHKKVRPEMMQMRPLLLLVLAARLTASEGSMFYIGCYKDTPSRDLPAIMCDSSCNNGKTNCGSNCWLGASSMTPALCSTLCHRYAFFGLQSGNQCFCGNDYGSYGKMPQAECNKKCSGDSSVMCGGFWRNSVYANSVSSGMVAKSNNMSLKANATMAYVFP